MPIRDWGIGLEELTEYYHRYGLYYTDNGLNRKSQNWLITRGVVDQSLRYSKRPDTGKEVLDRSPIEIDLVGFRIDHEGRLAEVRLIQCKESVILSMFQKIDRSFRMPRISSLVREAEKQGILRKFVSYVTITPNAEKMFQEHGIELLSFKRMAKKLVQYAIVLNDINRKGFALEPPLWLIRSLLDMKSFDKELENELRGGLKNVQ